MQTITIHLIVDSQGDWATGTDLEEAVEAYGPEELGKIPFRHIVQTLEINIAPTLLQVVIPDAAAPTFQVLEAA